MPVEKWTLNEAGSWYTDGWTAVAARSSWVYGDYKPAASTTGVYSLAALTTHSGNLTTTSHGQNIENLDITGRLIFRHHGVTVRNCRIQGGTPDSGDNSFGSVEHYSAQSPVNNFYDCTIMTSVSTVYAQAGIQGRDFNLYRCNVYGTVDGVKPQYSNVGVYGCYIHDLPWYSFDPGHGDGSHNDGIQVAGGSTFIFRGNLIECGYKQNAGMMINEDVGATSNLTIDKNWFTSVDPAAKVGINVSQAGASAMASVTITNNKFSPLSGWAVNHCALIDHATYDAATLSNNTYEATGLAAKVTRV
jgi:hypothetical protein